MEFSRLARREALHHTDFHAFREAAAMCEARSKDQIREKRGGFVPGAPSNISGFRRSVGGLPRGTLAELRGGFDKLKEGD